MANALLTEQVTGQQGLEQAFAGVGITSALLAEQRLLSLKTLWARKPIFVEPPYAYPDVRWCEEENSLELPLPDSDISHPSTATKASAVIPMSRAICRSSIGEISCPWWKGTVVPRPSGWRNCLWELRCRTSLNPSFSGRAMTSQGLRTGSFAMVRTPEAFAYQ